MGSFNEDGLLNRGFCFLGQLIALNLLWIISTLPVITAGASTTALFYCTLRIHKNGDCSVLKDFYKSFRQNFRQSTAVWLLLLLAAGGLYLERKMVLTMPEGLQQIFLYSLSAICIPLFITTLYIFPVLAAFQNTVRKLLADAFYFAVKNVGYTLAVASVTFLPMFFTFLDMKLFPVYLFIWLMCGFSLTAYADSWFLWKLFKPCFLERDERK